MSVLFLRAGWEVWGGGVGGVYAQAGALWRLPDAGANAAGMASIRHGSTPVCPSVFPCFRTCTPVCRAEEKLGAMRATFGADAVGMARINSATGEASDHGSVGYAALWRAHLRAPIPGGGAGEPEGRPAVPDQVAARVKILS